MTDYATLLRDRITLTCRCVDRIFLQAYVPNLQTPGLVARFLLGRGYPYPSSAALGKIGDAYVAAIHRFAEDNRVPFIHFKKGDTRRDLRQGIVYDLAFRQIEFSDTRVTDRPQAGRSFFEGVIRDHLDLGRPEEVALLFDRAITRRTPGVFRTKILTKGVDPQITIFYKSSRLKQYFKERRTLRTETVICDTRDFGVGRRVNADNWHALRAVGESANRRLCDAEAAAACPAPDVATFLEVTRPSVTEDHYVPGLRFGEPRVMALFGALASFASLVAGFTNRQLVELTGALLGAGIHQPSSYL